MKKGDVIVNIEGLFKITLQGYLAGYTNSYHIETEGGFALFSGTTEELMQYVAEQVRSHNDRVQAFGGRIV